MLAARRRVESPNLRHSREAAGGRGRRLLLSDPQISALRASAHGGGVCPASEGVQTLPGNGDWRDWRDTKPPARRSPERSHRSRRTPRSVAPVIPSARRRAGAAQVPRTLHRGERQRAACAKKAQAAPEVANQEHTQKPAETRRVEPNVQNPTCRTQRVEPNVQNPPCKNPSPKKSSLCGTRATGTGSDRCRRRGCSAPSPCS